MSTELPRDRVFRFLLTAAAVVVIIAGLRAAADILVPFLLASFIAVVSAPFLFWLKGRGLPGGLALTLVILVICGAGLLVGMLIGASLTDFTQALPVYQVRLREKFAYLLAHFQVEEVQISGRMLLDHIDPGAAMRLTSQVFAALAAMLSNGFLILLTVIFILVEASSFPAKLRAGRRYQEVVRTINDYMKIKTWISLVTGLLIGVWLAVLGVDYPLLWGVLVFLLNYVPNIGSIIAAVPAVLLALVQLGTTSALLAGAGYLIVNLVIGNVVEPRFMGRGLGLSTLVVFLSLIFWGWVWGPVGMLLSVPLTMMVKIALAASEETRRIAILIGSDHAEG
jgi:AI-2 transport protein TqsA